MEIIDELLGLIDEKGDRQYGSDPNNTSVSQRAHALQCALLAEQEGADATLVAAALLHDIGHLLHKEGERPASRGIDDRHELIGGKRLARDFGEAVAAPVRLHVPAKRYLCASDPDYFGRLSRGSVLSLQLQGGPMSADAAASFREQPFALDAVRLRRWDEAAKIAGLATPPLAHFRAALEAALAQGHGA